MALDSRHPAFDQYYLDWQAMRDTYAGERAVKARGFEYLPPTEGMIEDGADLQSYSSVSARYYGTSSYWFSRGNTNRGWRRYMAYRDRAVFYDFVAEAVRSALGVMHHKPAVFTLPKALEGMLQKASIHGEGLQLFLRKINEEQLVAGRLGLMLDLPQKPDPTDPLPYLAMYQAERCINWDDGIQEGNNRPRLNLVVLDESSQERDLEFEWKEKKQWRVLVLGDPRANETPDQKVEYSYAVASDAGTIPTEYTQPSLRGTKLQEIPFRFINGADLHSAPCDPPLIGLARLALAIYRGDADHRLGLFRQAQATLVRMGAGKSDRIRVGEGGSIDLPQGGDAKFIVAPFEGLEAQRLALNDDKTLAAQRAGSLFDTRSNQKEAAETHRIRAAAHHASLGDIADAGAAGLEDLLKIAAGWVGANPEEVSVKPNKDFSNAKMAAKELLELWSAKTMGAPIAKRTVHDLMRQGELTTRSYEEEQEEIEGEPPLVTPGVEDPNEPVPGADDEPDEESD